MLTCCTFPVINQTPSCSRTFGWYLSATSAPAPRLQIILIYDIWSMIYDQQGIQDKNGQRLHRTGNYLAVKNGKVQVYQFQIFHDVLRLQFWGALTNITPCHCPNQNIKPKINIPEYSLQSGNQKSCSWLLWEKVHLCCTLSTSTQLEISSNWIQPPEQLS